MLRVDRRLLLQFDWQLFGLTAFLIASGLVSGAPDASCSARSAAATSSSRCGGPAAAEPGSSPYMVPSVTAIAGTGQWL